MKRFLLAGLFVCALSLVNVANAGYEWTKVAPSGVATDAWKVVTIEASRGGGLFDRATVDVTANTADAAVSIVGANVTISFTESKFDLASVYFGFHAGGDGIISIKVNGFETTPHSWNTLSEKGYPNSSNPEYLVLDDGYINSLTYSFTVGYNTTESFTFAFASSLGDTPPQPSTTPEPATLAIFGLGLAGLGLCRRMRKK